ncbi:MAG: leucine-rich repeat domain-containing protein [Ruminococcus flavefaciens]|nr:leucine-rich repeat domain-containing protein [Ruminococcus flavefaciens]MCM1228733.1 leucine-rich repeat domain-containing protein [Ruminococcus flavefaciens]
MSENGGMPSAPTLEMLMNEIKSLRERVEYLESYSYFEVGNGHLIKYTGDLPVVRIPDTVTHINGMAFDEKRELIREVIIPDSVVRIENYAFFGCENLVSVNIPDSVERIGSYAFSGCESLGKVYIPDSVRKIESDAFSGCPNLEISIPSSCRCSAVFAGCKSFTRR